LKDGIEKKFKKKQKNRLNLTRDMRSRLLVEGKMERKKNKAQFPKKLKVE
jgi:hypothetical protein